jgi:Pyruvate kinase, barrel domain
MRPSTARRGRIVCTLGPATATPERITDLVAAGMDVARLNFSHGDHADHEKVLRAVREAAGLELTHVVTKEPVARCCSCAAGDPDGGAVVPRTMRWGGMTSSRVATVVPSSRSTARAMAWAVI